MVTTVTNDSREPPQTRTDLLARQRAYLAALCRKPLKGQAADAAGVDRSTPRKWREDPAFREAEEEAMQVGAERYVEEADRRAVEGELEPQYSRDGAPLYHPTRCRCGHEDDEHLRGPDGKPGPCPPDSSCGCEGFRPAPFMKRVVSDKLLDRLLTSRLREEFGDQRRIEIRGMLTQVNLTELIPRLPQAALSRLMDGEPIDLVLAELGDEALRRALEGVAPSGQLLPGGAELGGPGTEGRGEGGGQAGGAGEVGG
jgi:hypothetical protein